MTSYNNRQPPNPSRKGISLLTRLNSSRTCQEAGVPALYCPYVDWTTNHIPARQLTRLALKLVKFLNRLQETYFAKFGVSTVPCEKKTLARVQNGGILEPGKFYLVVFLGPEPSYCSEFEAGGSYEGRFKNVRFSVSDLSFKGG
jgi:hypothetical protein